MNCTDGYFYYGFDYAGVKAPWVSCMAQGEGISVLVRAYEHTGEQIYLDHCKKALAPLFKNIEEGGVGYVFPSGLRILEEYPKSDPDHVLNGLLYCLIGLIELQQVAPSDEVANLLDESRQTIEAYIDMWDLKYWSAYDGEGYGKGKRNSCTVSYHSLHVTQLTYVGTALNSTLLTETAQRWNKGLNSLPRRLQAMSGKIRYRSTNKVVR